MLGTILLRFLLRLIWGISVGLSATSPRLVSGDFFRVHLWVLLGLSTVAALVAPHGAGAGGRGVLAVAIAGALVCYAGSVLWLYDCRRAGRASLLLLAALSLGGALRTSDWPAAIGAGAIVLVTLDIVTSGLLMGTTMCAMFLGHWYLSTPSMRLEPLVRLVWLIGLSVFARAAVCGVGLAATVAGPCSSWRSWRAKHSEFPTHRARPGSCTWE
jgi:hypothetical protein